MVRCNGAMVRLRRVYFAWLLHEIHRTISPKLILFSRNYFEFCHSICTIRILFCQILLILYCWKLQHIALAFTSLFSGMHSIVSIKHEQLKSIQEFVFIFCFYSKYCDVVNIRCNYCQLDGVPVSTPQCSTLTISCEKSQIERIINKICIRRRKK